MQTAYLNSFVLTVDTGSMSEAARSLGLTPAAVAQQMQALEQELGVKLLARAGRTVSPTPAGQRLLKRARVLLRDVDELRAELGVEAEITELKIGTINTAMHSLFPDILARFVALQPSIKVYLQSATSGELYKAVRHGELDAAVCLYPAFSLPKTFGWALLRNEPLVLLAPAKLAGRPPHDLLRTEPFIRYDRSLGGGQRADRYLRQAGIEPRERFELSSLLAIAMMVDRGLGVALVPETASPLLEGLRLARLALPKHAGSRQFGVLWLRSSHRLRAIEALVGAATQASTAEDAGRGQGAKRNQIPEGSQPPKSRKGPQPTSQTLS